MEIRFAELRDVPGILALLRQVGGVHHDLRPDLFRSGAQKYGASQVISMLESSVQPVFVAAEGDRVLGYCFCQVKRTQDDPVLSDHTTLYIDDLCVDREHRNRKIGSALFSQVRRYAKARGCESLTLNVWACNEAALKFYERCGLTPQKIGMETKL